MKNKEIICALFVASAFAGCNERIDDFGKTTPADATNAIYIDTQDREAVYNITHTVNEGTRCPEGDTIWIKIPVHSTEPVAGDTEVRFVQDDDLISVYNEMNGTNYIAFASADLEGKYLTATIRAGKTVSDDSISVAYKNVLSKLSSSSSANYLLPLRILRTKGQDTKIDYTERVCYVKVHVKRESGIKVSTPDALFACIPSLGKFADLSNVQFTLAAQYSDVEDDTEIRLEVNNSLLDDGYRAVPGEIAPVSVIMKADTCLASGALSYAGSLSDTEGGYMIPLEIKSVSGGVERVNAEKLFSVKVNMVGEGTVSIASTTTDASANAEAEAGLGTQQGRSGYTVSVRNTATGLPQAAASSSYPWSNMVTDGTGYGYCTVLTGTIDVVIDLGKEVTGISGFYLNAYSSTASNNPVAYDICYATGQQYAKGQETLLGEVSGLLRHTYIACSEPFTARYIMLRNVKPGTSNRAGWQQFYVYTNK